MGEFLIAGVWRNHGPPVIANGLSQRESKLFVISLTEGRFTTWSKSAHGSKFPTFPGTLGDRGTFSLDVTISKRWLRDEELTGL